MTLGRRLVLCLLPLALVGAVLAATVAASGWVAWRQVTAANAATQRQRAAFEVSQRLLMARGMIDTGKSEMAGAMLHEAEADATRRLPAQAPLVMAAARDPTAGTVNLALNALARVVTEAQLESDRLTHSAQAGGRQLGLIGAVAALIVALGSLAVGLALRARVAGPIQRISRGVHRLSEGRLDERLRVDDGDAEVTTLARDVNHMAAELQAMRAGLEAQVRAQATELARAERLASTGFLAAGVAHEINNPLAVVSTEAELLERRRDLPDEVRAALVIIREESARCKDITRRLLATARGGSPTAARQKVDLRQAAESAVGIAGKFEQAAGRTITVSGAGALALADPAALRQVLLTLLSNALEASPPGSSPVRVQVSVQGDRACLRVSDSGRGMSGEEAARCFEPFWTTKRDPATPGLGLGLSIAAAIMAGQGGVLKLESSAPGEGSVFVMEWPLGSPENTHV